MPDSWNTGLICPIYKKGDKMICENYRGITLLSVVNKIFSNVLYKRLKVYTEEIFDEFQGGFQQNRGTIDQICIIRQIMEKFYEHDTVLHFLFIDYKQAFDSIDRFQLYTILRELGIPDKLVKLVKMTMSNTRAKIKINNNVTRTITYGSGVKQGDGLSAVLFNCALHKVMTKIDLNGNIFFKSTQICAYADDIVIIARDIPSLKSAYKEMEQEVRKVDLIVNEDKTKYMKLNSSEVLRTPQEIIIGERKFEEVWDGVKQ